MRPAGLDADYAGVGLELALERDFLSQVQRFAFGGSAGRLVALQPEAAVVGDEMIPDRRLRRR